MSTSPAPVDTDVDAEDAVDWIERVTRVGWISKGFVFVMIGVLAFRIALERWESGSARSSGAGDGSEAASQQGALRSIAEEPLGSVLLVSLAVGLTIFMVWKLVQTFAGRSGDLGPLNIAKRIGWAGLGIFYGALAWMAARLAFDGPRSTTSSSDETSPSAVTGQMLGLPGGRFLVGVVGLAVIVIGGYHLRKGVTYEFIDDLETDDLSPAEERWLGRFGVGGFVARGAVLGVCGWFLVRAAVQFDPSDAVGLDGALRRLADLTYGRVLLVGVSIGLTIAGAYDMATFRRQRM